jgi:hypothetical protein
MPAVQHLNMAGGNTNFVRDKAVAEKKKVHVLLAHNRDDENR